MPSFTVTSLVTYLGLILLGFGVFLVISGLGIVKVEQITVTQGQKTLIAGILFSIVGISLIILDSNKDNQTTVANMQTTQALVVVTQTVNMPIVTAVPILHQTDITLDNQPTDTIGVTPQISIEQIPSTTATFEVEVLTTSTIELPATPILETTPTTTQVPQPVGKIVFSSNRSGTSSLHVMNANGTNQQIISNYTAKLDFNPVWSRDGTKIAFISFRDDPRSPALLSHIYVMNADGTNLTRLTASSWYESAPSWSPDGTKIAYYADPDSDEQPQPADIYIFDFLSRRITRLTEGAGNSQDPSWSPDGTKIVFYSDRHSSEGNYELYTMNADGSNEMRLTFQGGINYIPVWSPDGSKIAYTSGRNDNAEIYIINADGSNPHRLLTGPDNGVRDWFPTWSPDGLFIAYSSGSGENQDIWVAQIDSREPPKNITNNTANDWYPNWTK